MQRAQQVHLPVKKRFRRSAGGTAQAAEGFSHPQRIQLPLPEAFHQKTLLFRRVFRAGDLLAPNPMLALGQEPFVAGSVRRVDPVTQQHAVNKDHAAAPAEGSYRNPQPG